MKKKILLLGLLLHGYLVASQSVEIMPGNNFVFTDVQFLVPFDEQFRLTLFSRTRARLTYDDKANGVDFFSGSYLNYTLKSGIGGSAIGRFNNTGSDLDIGIHFLKQTELMTLFILPSYSLSEPNTWSWFSIIRILPKINEEWRVYVGIEFFTALEKTRHIASTQRLRLGLDIKDCQFGLAMNITEIGEKLNIANENYGLFLRKEF